MASAAFGTASSCFAVATILAAALLAATASAQDTPQDFLRLHNGARAADGVGPVTWDARVARYAESYAAKRAEDCQLVHSGGPFGENLFLGSAGRLWSAVDALRSWVNEKRNYHLSNNTCDAGKVCEHYTQVVWRRSTRIGCASVACAGPSGGVFIICSYDPPGNFNGQRPFLTLDAAAK